MRTEGGDFLHRSGRMLRYRAGEWCLRTSEAHWYEDREEALEEARDEVVEEIEARIKKYGQQRAKVR